ncbi:EAL domain-containing protein [Halobacillus sp. A5]|uniref:EAL and HDOD domain-containing protein n=1 Tax=Halobacillus sp. A5 TaxID=2880263 RepID=UPI0020A65198|nr:EAL domain-containing protein [Halobacillus sp. A5]
MEVFVARQPIINLQNEIHGYEILYRNSEENTFPHTDGSKATKEVLVNSFLTIGLERLSQNKPCFINFTEDLLLEKIPEYFDSSKLIVEVLEDVAWNRDLVRVCRELKKKGFSIALDDIMSVEQTDIDDLLTYVDILKVDIRQSSAEVRKQIAEIALSKGITLLAEKVETSDELEQCREEGFELFQGYYISRPVIISAVDIPLYHSSYYQVIKELSVEEDKIDKERVIQIFQGDLSLTYKLLRLINFSSALSEPVHTIKQAVQLFGMKPLKKWLYVFTVEEEGPAPASQEAMKSSLQRAKMCEQIGISIGHNRVGEEYFLTGLLSSVDIITGSSPQEVMTALPLDLSIKQALKGEKNMHRCILDVVVAVEKADFDCLDPKLEELGISLNEILEIYGQAIAWTEQLYNRHLSLEEVHG